MTKHDTRYPRNPSIFAKATLCALGLLIAGAGAWGGSYTWTGGGSPDTSWTNPSNWGQVTNYPGISGNAGSDVAYIDGTYTVTLNGNIIVSQLDFNYGNSNPVTLNLAGYTLTVNGTVNFGSSGGGSPPASNVSIIGGHGAINCTTIDANQSATNQINLTNYVTIAATGTFYGDQQPGTDTIINGDGTCSISAGSFYIANGTSTYAGVVMNNMQVIAGGYTYYSPTLSAMPAASSTITVTVSGTFPIGQTFQYTYDAVGSETYTLQNTTATNQVAISGTQNTRQPFGFTNASANQFQFQIVYPAVAAGDGINITVYTPSPSNIAIGTIPFTQSTGLTTTTWTGTTGLWTDSTWTNGAPTSSMDAVINSGTVTLAGPSSAKSVTIASGATLNLAGHNLSVTNTISNSGTVRISANETVGGSKFNASGSTVEYYGTSTATGWGSNYQNLTVSGSLTLPAGTTNVAGLLTSSSGSSLSIGSNTLSFASCSGTGTGVVAINSGTITATGAGGPLANLAITTGATVNGGSTGITLSGYTAPSITTTGAVTLAAGSVGNLTVTSGTLTLAGTLSVGGALSGAGTILGASPANLDVSSSSSASIGSLGNSTTSLFRYTPKASGTISVANNWNVSSYTTSGDKVAFTGTGTIYSATTFYDATFGGTTSANTGFAVSHDLTINASLAGGGNTITVGRNWTNNNGSSGFSSSGTVAFNDNTQTSQISGATTFSTLSCTTAGKILSFQNGNLITATTLTISPASFTGASDLITLQSQSAGSQWSIRVSGTKTVQHALVSDSIADTYAITATSSKNVSNNTNWTFPASTLTWVGGVSTNWTDGGNWDLFYVPNSTDSATINTGSSHNLDIGGLTTATKITNLTIQGTLNASLAGAIDILGNLNVISGIAAADAANATWSMSGTAGPTISSSLATSIGSLTIKPGAGNTISLSSDVYANAVALTSGTLSATTHTLHAAGNVSQGGGKVTFTTGTLDMDGSSAQTLDPTNSSLVNLSVSGGAATQLQAALTSSNFTGNLLVSSGSLDMNSYPVTMSGSQLRGTISNSTGTTPAFRATAALTLMADTSITTYTTSGGGNITFDSTVDSNTNGGYSLTADANTGTVTFSGAVGATASKALSFLLVSHAQTAVMASTTTAGASGISVTATTINLPNVTLNASASANAQITLTGSVVLNNPTAGTSSLTAGNGSTVTVTGAVSTYSPTIANALSATAGSGGISFSSTLGASGQVLGAVSLAASGSISLSGDAYLSSSADFTIRGYAASTPINVAGALANCSITAASLGHIKSAQRLVIGASGAQTGAVAWGDNSAYALAVPLRVYADGALGVLNFNPSAQLSTIDKAIQLYGTQITLNGGTTTISSYSATGANVSFTGPLTTATAGYSLAVNAGQGTVSFSSTAGASGLALGDLSLIAEGNPGLTFSGGAGSVHAATIELQASTTARTIGISNAASNLNITATNLNALATSTSVTVGSSSQSGTLTVGGATTITSNLVTLLLRSDSGLVAFNASLTLSGSTALEVHGQTGATGVNFNTATPITTSSQTINIYGDVLLSANCAVSSIGSGTGASITFQNKVNGNNTFAVSAGASGNTASGDVTFTGAVGGDTPLSTITGITCGTFTAASIATNSAAITLNIDDYAVSGAVNVGTNSVNIYPRDTSGTVSYAINVNNGSSGLNITETELQNISSSGTVTIGATTWSGAINVGSSGSVNLSGRSYNLTLQGTSAANNNILTFNFTSGNTLTLGSNKTFLADVGTVASSVSGVTAVTIGGTGTARFIGEGNNGYVGTSAIPISINAANLGAGGLSSATNSAGNDYYILSTSASALNVSGAIQTNAAGRNISIDGGSHALTIGAIVNAGAGTVSLAGLGVTNGATVTGQGGITVAAGTGTFDNTAGTLTNTSGSNTISITADGMSLAGGTITANSAPVNITSATPTQAITIGGGGSGLGLSQTELNTIHTSGPLTIGDIAHTGGIQADNSLTLANPTGAVNLLTEGNSAGNGNVAFGSNAVTVLGNLTINTTGATGTTVGSFTYGKVSGSGALWVGSAGGYALHVTANEGIVLTSASNLATSAILANGSRSGDVEFAVNRACTISSATNGVDGGHIYIDNESASALVLGTITATHASATTAYVSIKSAGAATQSGIVTAPDGLELLGAGSFDLSTQNNLVSAIAASTTGAVSLNSALSLSVAQNIGATPTSGVTTTSATSGQGNVSLSTITSSKDITLNQPITTSAGTVTLNPTGVIYLNYGSATVNSIATGGTGHSVSLQKAVYLECSTSITAGTAPANRASFSSTLDSISTTPYAFKVTGDALFSGNVGGAHALSSLTVTGATATGASVTGITTSGAQTYTGAVTIGTGVTFTGGSGPANKISFGNTLGSGSNITGQSVTITTSDAEFDGLVGGASNLVTTVSVAGATTIKASGVTTSATSGTAQTYSGAVTTVPSVGTSVTFTGGGSGAGGALIWFKSTLGSGSATGYDISISNSNVEFDGAVGNNATNAVQSLGVAGTTALYATAVTTLQGQTYTGAVTLFTDASFASNSATLYTVRFASTLNSDTGGYYYAHVQTAMGEFDGAVGVGRALNYLTVDGAATVQSSVHTTTTQTYSSTLAVSGTAATAVLYSDGVNSTSNLIQVSGTATIGNGCTLNLGNTTTGNYGVFSLQDVAGPSTGTAYLTANTNGAVAINGNVGSGTVITTITVTQSGGTTFKGTVTAGTVDLVATAAGSGTPIEFQNALTVNTQMTLGGSAAFDLHFNYDSSAAHTSTITSAAATNLSTTGSIVFGLRSDDVILFTSGLTATNATGSRHLIGSIQTRANPISLGDSILDGDASVDATANWNVTYRAGNTVNLGSVAGAHALVVNCGNATANDFTQGASKVFTVQSLRIIANGNIGVSGTPISTAVSYFEARSFNGTVYASNTLAETIGFSSLSAPFEGLFTGSNSNGLVTGGANAISLAVTSASKLTFAKLTTAGATGSVTATAADIDFDTSTFTATPTMTGNGGIALYPNANTNINLSNGTTGFALSANDMRLLSSSLGASTPGTVTIGLKTGAGSASPIFVGSASTALGLGTTNYNLTLDANNQGLAFAGSSGPVLALSSDKTLTIDIGTGAIAGSGVRDISLPYGTTGGILYILSAGNVGTGTGTSALQTAVDQLRAAVSGAMYISELDGVQLGNAGGGISSTGGLIDIAAGGNASTGNALSTSGGSLKVAATGTLTVSNAISTTAPSGTSIDLSGSSVSFNAASASRVGAYSSNQISVKANSANITDAGNTTLGASGSGSTLALTASSGIGASSTARILTDVGVIEATTATGGIFITEADGVILGDATAGVNATTSGSIYVTSTAGAISTVDSNTRTVSTAGSTDDVYINGTTLTLSCPVSAGRVVSLTSTSATPTITVGSTNSAITGGTGTATLKGLICNGAVTHSAGTITMGSGGALFAGDFTGPGGTLNGDSAVGVDPDIEFDGAATLGTFVHNGDRLVFAGSALQILNTNDQHVGNVLINNALGVRMAAGSYYAVRQTNGTYTLTIQAGFLDLSTNSIGWIADSANTVPAATDAGLFHGIVGTLTFPTGATPTPSLRCGSLALESGYTVNNQAANTLTVAGSATIGCTMGGTITNSTLSMTGTGNLDATVQIGNLTVTGNATLAANLSLAGNVTIGPTTGVLDVGANYEIDVAGNWTNNIGNTGFLRESGNVKFTKPVANGTIQISGSTTWYDFSCSVQGQTIQFANHPAVQTFADSINVAGTGSSSGQMITMTRLTPGPNPTDPTDPLQAGLFWDINVLPSAPAPLANLKYVDVYYSNASLHPLTPDVTVIADWATTIPTHYCYKWLSGLTLVYSYTEDSDGNGKIDRIRVQAAAAIGNDFSGFVVNVEGYTVVGYSRPALGANFYILLKEKGYNDTGATPRWRITKNTSLKDAGTDKKLASAYEALWMTPTDTAIPRIAYTLSPPNYGKVFVHMSEPITAASTTAAPVTFSGAGASAVEPVPLSATNSADFLVTGSSLNALTLAGGGVNITINGAVDRGTPAVDVSLTGIGSPLPHPFYPTALGSYAAYDVTPANGGSGIAPPYGTTAASALHRVTDVLISEPMTAAANLTYFVWPIYAKDNVQVTLTDDQIAALTAAQSAAEGIGLIRAFDGSQWLRDQDITLQARLQPGLSSMTGVKLWFDSNVSSELTSSTGLWLPSFLETGFSGLAPFPDASPWGRGATGIGGTQVATNLWNFAIPSSDPRIVSVSTVGFFFTLTPSPTGLGEPLYIARLDMTPGTAMPSNWYYRVKPFSFVVHNVTKQRGGVTILNNVIDPTKGETVRLSYQLKKSGAVTATVFTLDGDVVARLVNEANQDEGDHAVSWDGKNLGGRPVARGLYFIRIVAPGMDEIRKVLVVRK